MEATPLDNEFMQYWSKLSRVEKESLLSVAKHYAELKEGSNDMTIEQYNKEIAEAMERMDEGEFYTHDRAVQISKGWLNGK